MKTLIELFDDYPINNAVAAMHFKPEKIIFVGFTETMKKNRINALKTFFDMRNMDVETEFEIVGRYDYESICQKLDSIIEQNEDCVFDLTGGKEIVLAAMGTVAEKRDIPMVQFGVRTAKFTRVSRCDKIEEPQIVSMTIPEIITLNGGLMMEENVAGYSFSLTDDFKDDLEKMWQICCINCKSWNRQSFVLSGFEGIGILDEDLRLTVDINYAERRNYDTYFDIDIMMQLLENGLISDYKFENHILSFKYKNEQVHNCILKAGNILELYVCNLLEEIRSESEISYGDIRMGVIVDWDGIIHDAASSARDTKNEIDLMATYGMTPIFISCKNGEVNKDDIYELSAVAEKFGGEFSKKLLITTFVSADEDKKKYIKQRAIDLKVDIIDGVDKLERDKFKKELRSRAK